MASAGGEIVGPPLVRLSVYVTVAPGVAVPVKMAVELVVVVGTDELGGERNERDGDVVDNEAGPGDEVGAVTERGGWHDVGDGDLARGGRSHACR